MNIGQVIANELKVKLQQVTAAIELLDGGSTVPFISAIAPGSDGWIK